MDKTLIGMAVVGTIFFFASYVLIRKGKRPV